MLLAVKLLLVLAVLSYGVSFMVTDGGAMGGGHQSVGFPAVVKSQNCVRSKVRILSLVLILCGNSVYICHRMR